MRKWFLLLLFVLILTSLSNGVKITLSYVPNGDVTLDFDDPDFPELVNILPED